MSIIVKNLTKDFTFSVKNKTKGFWSNLFNPDKKSITAVSDISFIVEQGERIAFIGPNGAGKSTTIKMLTGILFPTSGDISVLGLNPQLDRKKLAYDIGTVFGQRSQLFPNLPFTDSFEFFGVMYDMTKDQIRKRTDELITLFGLKDFKNQPVRKLSLGQRMRAEIATSLFHKPKIIFLDEPTIGLDVVAKKALRELLLKINKEENTTIFLTSHDVGDIEALCDRTVIINHGELVKDLPTRELTSTFIHEKYIEFHLAEPIESFPKLPEYCVYKETLPMKIIISVETQKLSVSEALQKVLPFFEVQDINVYGVELETVIREIYERTQSSK